MSQIGLINIIRTTSSADRGSGVLGPALGLIAVVVLGVGGYRVRDTPTRRRGHRRRDQPRRRLGDRRRARRRRLTAAGWVLLAHHRTLRDAPTVAAFTAATDRAFAPHHHRQLDRTTDAGGRELHQVTAVRLDRLEPGQVNP
ncbi:MAG: hypothetical protein K0S40_165 [Actinomycetospora sp.]|nr:hypothetical protein [Actinomycetospora sp.]